MTETTDEPRWLRALENLDLATVRNKLDPFAVGVALDVGVSGFVDDAPFPTRRFIEAWMAARQKATERRDAWRFWVIFILAAVSAAAAVIAAWPVLFAQH